MKLLIVDDDAKIAAALRRGLTAEGFSVEVAADGPEGLWRAREGGYDLILLDIMLPGRNGYRVCADLRRAGDTTPILMLTAKDGDLDEAEAWTPAPTTTSASPSPSRCSSPGCTRCCAAPPWARRRRWRPATSRLDLRARRVRRGGDGGGAHRPGVRPAASTCVRRAGHVVTKRQILAGVWDDEFEGDPNVVEVYVARLRRKLGGPADALDVETVRGAGYRLSRT